MNSRHRGSGLGIGENAALRNEGRIDEYIIGLINGSLAESLPIDTALAVRLCLNTSAALNDPAAYVAVLKGIVGYSLAAEVVARAEKKLRDLNAEPMPAGLDFPEMILDLRSKYSNEAMEKWK
ncbi:MAG TPA: hypothetical protein VEC02_02375 [Nitrososphaerales archaeon]|nr:hypothetical protein [Nitrososphaerales archaeon]